MNEEDIEKYIRERAHQMFTEAPELWNHQGVIRQYLRRAYLDGVAKQRQAWGYGCRNCMKIFESEELFKIHACVERPHR